MVGPLAGDLSGEGADNRNVAAPLTRSGLAGKRHLRNTGRDVETGTPFETDRLQSNRIAGTANQHVGTEPYSYGGAAGRPTIGSGERAWPWIGDRCYDGPNQHSTGYISDIDAE